MKNDDEAQGELEEGSGNVFADLGLEDAEELFARAKIGFHVYKIVQAKSLKQREIAPLLGIKPPEVSHLMNGHFNRFYHRQATRLPQAARSQGDNPDQPASARGAISGGEISSLTTRD